VNEAGDEMRGSRRASVPLAFTAAAVAVAMLSGCVTQAQSSTPKLHLQEVNAVRVISPHLAYARTKALVPKDHYWGIVAGSVTTCGREGVNLNPTEMASRPVTVTLWHQGKRISSVRLVKRSGFAFLLVGGDRVHFPFNSQTMEQPTGWSPQFTLRTDNGFSGDASLGGLGGIGEIVFQIPSRPHLHPCYPDRPSIADTTRATRPVTLCNTLSIHGAGEATPATGEHDLLFTLANVSHTTCDVIGYPKITVFSQSGRVLPFRFLHGQSPYTSNRPPKLVTLAPGAKAYVEVSKYRCDAGDVARATTLRVTVPVTGQVLTLEQHGPGGVSTFNYCRGGRNDAGNRASVSPVSVSANALVPKW
jgi:Protein of unknown function (DUF4232)